MFQMYVAASAKSRAVNSACILTTQCAQHYDKHARTPTVTSAPDAGHPIAALKLALDCDGGLWLGTQFEHYFRKAEAFGGPFYKSRNAVGVGEALCTSAMMMQPVRSMGGAYAARVSFGTHTGPYSTMA